MTDILGVFAPYLKFIVIIITIGINILYVSQSMKSQAGFSIVTMGVINAIISIIINLIVVANPRLKGLIEYDFISLIVKGIAGVLDLGVKTIFDEIGKLIQSLINGIRSIFAPDSGAGGGGGGRSR